MSIGRQIYLYCDGDPGECPFNGQPFSTDSQSLAYVQRQQARREGWAYSDGKDYCPDCRKRKPKQ